MLCHVFWSQVEYKIVCFITALHPRLAYLLYTLCLRLIAALSCDAIQGGSFSLHVMILLGMCVDKMSIRDLVKSSVISSTSNEQKAATQLMLEIDDHIASLSAFE